VLKKQHELLDVRIRQPTSVIKSQMPSSIDHFMDLYRDYRVISDLSSHPDLVTFRSLLSVNIFDRLSCMVVLFASEPECNVV